MNRTEKIMVCDVCNKSVSDNGEIYFGGYPHSGWFTVHRINGSSALHNLQKKKDWDICSPKCLKKLAHKETAF